MSVEFKASHRYARMSARKARLVVDLIRGQAVNRALDDLAHDRHRASRFVRKVLASAVANALQNPSVRASRLVVNRAYVNGGPLLLGRLRYRPGPMGRAMPIRKRTCHIHLTVTDPTLVAPPAAPEKTVPVSPPKKTGAGPGKDEEEA